MHFVICKANYTGYTNFDIERKTVKRIFIGFAILTIAFFVGKMEGNLGVWGWVVAPFGLYFVIRGRKQLDEKK